MKRILLQRYEINKGPAANAAQRGQMDGMMAEPLKKTVGTQSIYRESEAQTLPYTPDFITKDAPEILTLRNLTYSFAWAPFFQQLCVFWMEYQLDISQLQTRRPTEVFHNNQV